MISYTPAAWHELWDQATDEIIHRTGMLRHEVNTIMTMFLKDKIFYDTAEDIYIVKNDRVVFDYSTPYHKPRIPNEETQKAISDADAGKNLRTCENLKELIEDLQDDETL